MRDQIDLSIVSGTALRRARIVRGLKQYSVSEFLGVSQSTMSKWERGTLVPSAKQCQRLADLFAARLHPLQDAWLQRLVESSGHPVHVMCEATHRLLAASPPRISEWQRDISEIAARPLSLDLPPDIAGAETRLNEVSLNTEMFVPVIVHTRGRSGGPYEIDPALMLWERLQLSGGEWIRLVTNVKRHEIPAGALMLN